MNIDVYDLVKVLIGVIVALCVWISLREINRLSKQGSRITALELGASELKSNMISRPELKAELAELSIERLRLHEENKEKLDQIIRTTQGINDHSVEIARVQVRLTNVEAYQQYLRDWKHNVVDPLVPRAVEDHERRLQKQEARS